MRPIKAADSIFFLLNKANQSANRHWSALTAEFGVTGVQGLILVFLLEKDAVTATDLRQLTTIDSATLTGVVDRLEKTGWVERRKKPGDRRANLICLTSAGNTLAEQIRTALTSANTTFLSAMSDIEIKLLRSLLRRIHDAAD